jgi:hypothetical protein
VLELDWLPELRLVSGRAELLGLPLVVGALVGVVVTFGVVATFGVVLAFGVVVASGVPVTAGVVVTDGVLVNAGVLAADGGRVMTGVLVTVEVVAVLCDATGRLRVFGLMSWLALGLVAGFVDVVLVAVLDPPATTTTCDGGECVLPWALVVPALPAPEARVLPPPPPNATTDTPTSTTTRTSPAATIASRRCPRLLSWRSIAVRIWVGWSDAGSVSLSYGSFR